MSEPQMSTTGDSLEARNKASLGRSFVGHPRPSANGPSEDARQSSPTRLAGAES
jgi:hypothetical protein